MKEINHSVLVIGCGFGQLPLIEKAKDLGCVVVGIDRNPNALGAKYCDYFYEVDVKDKEIALEIAEKHKVKACFTMQSDIAMPSVGYVNTKMGLIGPSYDVAVCCSDKVQTRKKLKSKEVSQPKFEVAKNLKQAQDAVKKMGFPCVIKAPDSSGSRGVHKILNAAQVESAFEDALSFSLSKKILVEEYIDGEEHGAQSFSINGQHETILIHNDILSQPPYMIPIAHSFPSKLSKEIQEDVILNISKALSALDISDGPSNIDFILTKEGQIKVIEIGCRMGATCLPELLYYHTRVDWVESLILHTLGKGISVKPKDLVPVAAYILESPETGKFISCSIDEGSELEKIKENILEFEVTAQRGEEVSILKKGTDRIGKVVAKGDSFASAEKNCLNLISKLRLEIQ